MEWYTKYSSLYKISDNIKHIQQNEAILLNVMKDLGIYLNKLYNNFFTNLLMHFHSDVKYRAIIWFKYSFLCD